MIRFLSFMRSAGLGSLILCRISPQFEKMRILSKEGSSSRTVRILVLSDVMAMGPPKEATEMSINSWLSLLNLFPKVFSEKTSTLQAFLLIGNTYHSKSIIKQQSLSSIYFSHILQAYQNPMIPLVISSAFKYINININSEMGNAPPPAKKPTIEDTMIEMKMASKRMARESTKSMKESQQYMKKAKEALKKNNEEGAKLYLQSAASKRAESMSIQRMGLKMEFICGNMKTMQNNQAIMGSFDKMTAMLNYSNSPNFQVMSNNLQNFEKTMDEMLINGKMMEELMSNQNGIVDSTAEDMLNVLKGELAMETSNQVNEAALIKQKEMEFQEDLKKL